MKNEWRTACENLNSMKDAKKYWSQFSRLVGSFKIKLYPDIKLNGKTATTDQERAETFASHMQNTCKTPEGKEFDEQHKKNVEEHIMANKFLYNPLNNISKNDHDNIENLTKNDEKFLKKITVKELKIHIMKTPNKAPGDSIYPQHLKIGSSKLCEILTILYNASLDLGYFANKWGK